MREQLVRLCELQGLDIEVDRRKKSLAGLDDGASAKVEVDRLTAELSEVEAKRKETETEYHDRDIALKGIEEKKKKAQDLMYSGKVSNPRELEDLQKEVAMFDKEIDKLSTRVLELMDEQEVVQKKEAESQAALAEAQKTLEEVVSRYETTSSRLKEEITSLQSQREALVKDIPKPLMRRYEQIQSSRGVLAAVAMKSGVCDGCHVTLPSHLLEAVQASKSPQTCESCGRLLIWMGKEEEEEPEEEPEESE
ncbi:MAG: hypothetical protein GTN69_04390 [Armatimonadetes bacterium]|nr:hypothetical protein [Armatimonadota bacterium]NIO75123.1 hypothetical protein [Armatimonadota bacterium]NIO95747.1 hypothetical protein [Armatimonadota bacterium]